MPYLFWPWAKQETSNNKNVNTVGSEEVSIPGMRDRAIAATSELGTRFTSLPLHLIALCAFSLGSVSSLSALYVYKKLVKRIPNADWVTPDMLAKKRWVKGYVTKSVS